MSTRTVFSATAASRSSPADGEAYSRHLAQGESRRDPWQAIPWRRSWPLQWGLSAELAGSSSANILKRLERMVRSQRLPPYRVVAELEPWLAAAGRRPCDLGFACECLGWSFLVRKLAGVLPAGPWHALVRCLLDRTRRLPPSLADDAPLTWLLLAVELAWVLGYQLPELPAGRKLQRQAPRRLSAGLRRLDRETGLPHGRDLALLRPLLASFTRCAYLAQDPFPAGWDEDDARRYRELLRRALQLTRQDGTQVLTGTRAPSATVRSRRRPEKPGSPAGTSSADDGDDLFAAALRLAAHPELDAIADQVLPRGAAAGTGLGEAQFAPPMFHAPEARVAVLRPSWHRGREQLTVVYSGRQLHAELNQDSTTLWSGNWNPEVTVDGRRLEPSSDWRDLCWFSDDDLDYLELELELDGRWRVQRQLILAREDGFLYVADALLGKPSAGRIQYSLQLPIAAGVGCQPAPETREAHLAGRGRIAAFLPLALPEWRVASATGELTAVDRRVVLRQQGSGSRLYVPLLIDLDRRRLGQPVTWRQLTVAQQSQVQPPSVAVGYRVQIGQEQWVFYRSLAPPANRTVLGHNLTCEFYAGRFDEEGEAEQLIHVDGSDQEAQA